MFFTESRTVGRRLADLYDFVWPAVGGMHCLQNQVEAYVRRRPDAISSEIAAGVLPGLSLHGLDLRKAFIRDDSEKRTQSLSRFLLIGICALFESWLEELIPQLGPKQNIKGLQFPESVGGALTALTANASPTMSHCFHPVLVRQKKYASGKALDAQMQCYRFFKEARNAIAHNGGLADPKLMTAHGKFLKSKKDLGTKEIPEHQPPVLNQPVELSLRGVVGFGDIVLRLITTMDAELARGSKAEGYFCARWRHQYGPMTTYPTAAGRAVRRARLDTIKAGFPSPDRPASILALLRSQGLVF